MPANRMPQRDGLATGRRVRVSGCWSATIGVGGAACCIGLPRGDTLRTRTPCPSCCRQAMGTPLRSTFWKATSSTRSSAWAGTVATRATTGRSAASFFGQGNDKRPATRRQPVRADRARRREGQRQRDADQHRVLQHHQPAGEPRRRELSNNTTISNVAVNNGNGATATVRRRARGCGLFGGALGNGNTTQHVVLLGEHLQPAVQPVRRRTQSKNTAMRTLPVSTATAARPSTTSRRPLRDGLVRPDR